MTRLVRTRNALQEAMSELRAERRRVAFVPTMGALHDGHLSLVSIARLHADAVAASIFVNPKQFAPGEDLDAYPRAEADDLARLEAAGCSLVYAPSVEEMYPEGSVTNVRVEDLSDLLDGVHRPHFFYGVTTIVARLFIHVQPDVAVFGEKDYQQLQIIRRMVCDLGFPIEIIGGSTVRDPDGLAQSSRNAYLSPQNRKMAGTLFAALHRAARRIEAGRGLPEALDEARAHVLAGGFTKLDYVDAVDPDTLHALGDGATGEARLLGAAWIGQTRLIDNLGMTLPAR